MKKEELVHFHILLAQFKNFCEENGFSDDFRSYENLGIYPFQVYRSKEEHKRAIFVLANELVSSLAANSLPVASKGQKNVCKRKLAI